MSWQAKAPLTHDNAHGRPDDLDPRVNGPFLDDVRADQERAYRESRNKNNVTEDYSDLTVPELKDELRDRDLSLSGNKPELIERLEENNN